MRVSVCMEITHTLAMRSHFREAIDQHSLDFLFHLFFICHLCLCSSSSLSLSLPTSLSCDSRKKNQTDNAIRMMKRCIELDVTYVKAHLALFRMHGAGSQGALILTDAIKANPDNFKLRLAYGEWLLNNGKNIMVENVSPLHYITQKHITYSITLLQFSFPVVAPLLLHSLCALFSLCLSGGMEKLNPNRTCTCCNAYIPTYIREECVEQACNYWHLQVNAKNGSMVAIAFANDEVGVLYSKRKNVSLKIIRISKNAKRSPSM